MKRSFALFLALLLLLSATVGTASCGSHAEDSSVGEHGNASNDQPITGTAYDGTFFTSMIPDGMKVVTEGKDMALYMDFAKGITLMIQNRQQTLNVTDDGKADFSSLENAFSQEQLLQVFSDKTSDSGILAQSYSVLSEYRLYQLELETKASYDPAKTLFASVFVIISLPDAENRVTVTTMVLNGDSESRAYINAIRPVLK